MTLVGLEENGFAMMVSVQQHYAVGHRGNVIVANETKQPSQAQQKRKMYSQSTPYGATHQPASVARRNARERNRVKQVNNGFATLRQHIPQSLAQALGSNTAGTHGGARAGSKKLSKVETLRMAVEYIRNLQQLLEEHDTEPSSSTAGSPKNIQSDHHQQQEIKFELKSESGDDDVMHHHHHHHHHHQLQHNQVSHQRQSPVYIPAPCSEASSSPTPSFVSEASSAGGSQGYGTSFTSAIYATHPDGYDNYEPMSPEDEELLDYISLWQQGQ